MIDVHIHGGYDIDAMDANSDGLVTLGKEMLKRRGYNLLPNNNDTSSRAIEAALLREGSERKKERISNIFT